MTRATQLLSEGQTATAPWNRAAAGRTAAPRIEAYGVKGLKSTPWHKTFRNAEALCVWLEKTGAECHGTREVE